nr:MAG TPA_asm: hypothetical protein [Caudoviricetes sp.]
MSNVRGELQRWVEGGSWADQGYESELIPVDLARRVLAEMSETETVIEDSDSSAARIHRSLESTREKLKGVRAERDAALATLAEVWAEHQPKTEPCADCSKLCSVCASECVTCETPWPCLTARLCYTTDELETP